MNDSAQINTAIAAHRKWKAHLQQAIETGTSGFQPSVVKQDNQCDFGKWLYHQIPPELQQSPHYQSVKQQHARFHQETGAILEMALQGRKAEAQQALGIGGTFAALSSALRSEMMALYMEALHARKSSDKAGSQDKTKAVLEERARALSKVTEVQTSEGVPLVVFSLANETYGIATEHIKEVQPLRDITPVPCTPEFVIGVVNIRGSIYSVIDIRSFFGVQRTEIGDSTKVILVNGAGLEVGILADDVKGATSVLLNDIKPPLTTQAAVKEEYIQGVTKEMLIVLNLVALLRDERIIVREEVG
jgi:purine-binding chemotaxis protein CheW